MMEKIKNLVKENPILLKYTRKLLSLNSESVPNKRIIKGSLNKVMVDASATLQGCIFDIVGDNNKISIHSSCILNNVVFYIRGNDNAIQISKNVRFNRGGEIWIEDYNCGVRLGEDSTYEDVHIAVTEPNSAVTIGKDCMFANGIDVRTGDSHSIFDIETGKRINYAKNIIIGNHVWVAAHVSILKGVNLPNNTIVATRAVVTKAFEKENSLIGGTPAKVIKSNVNWNRQRTYDSL